MKLSKQHNSPKNSSNTNRKAGFLLFCFLMLTHFGYGQLATEYFESGIPSDWTTTRTTTGTATLTGGWASTTDGYLGTNGAFVNPSVDNIGATKSASYYMITPQFTASAGQEIHFWTKLGNAPSTSPTTYAVKLSVTGTATANFATSLISYTETTLNINGATWEEKVVVLPATVGTNTLIYLAFVATNTQPSTTKVGNPWYIDNVRVITPCAPVNISDIHVAAGVDNATITWTHSTATNFSVEIVPKGAGHGFAGIPINAGSSQPTYTMTGLEPFTCYDIYVKANCEVGANESGWTGPVALCTQTPTPSDCAGAINVCGNGVLTLNPSGGIGAVQEVSSCAGSEHNSLWLKVTIAQGGAFCFDIIPQNTALTTDYDFFVYGPNKSIGGLGSAIRCSTTNPVLAGLTDNITGTSLSSLITTSGPGPSGDGYVRCLDVLPGEFYYIAIDRGSGDGGFEVQWKGTAVIATCSSCPAPFQVTHKNLTQTSVKFSWDNVGGFVNNWEYLVKLAADGAPTGTETSIVSTVSNIDNIFTGLAAGTEYNVYVRSVCGGTPGEWSLAHLFKTVAICPAPEFARIVPNSLTTTSATFSWNQGFQEMQWEVVVQPKGTGIPITNGMLISPTLVSTGGVNVCSYTITGLAPLAQYEFWVRSYCDATHQSIWVGPVNLDLNVVYIPDANFKNALLQSFYPVIDTNSDGEIQVSEALNVSSINVEGKDISDMTGINSFAGLKNLYCSYNNITSLDLSMNPLLEYLVCMTNSSLTYLNLKNGHKMIPSGELFYGCSNLKMICVDDDEIEIVKQIVTNSNLTNVSVSSYCSLTPAGDYNTIAGMVKLDANANGCDNNDSVQPKIKININDGTTQGATYTNAAGKYKFYTQSGNFTLTPAMENSTWFAFTPSTAAVTFADNANNTTTQDYCMIANEVHHDVDVVIVPVLRARPGFTAEYKIVYRNKGNQTANGSVNFVYPSALMDYLSATVTPVSNTAAGIVWDYTNLQPFETRSVNVKFRVHAPTETNPVNIGDKLNFTVQNILNVGADENLADNNFSYIQTVVGSYDPNDITCLEGEILSPTEIGKYLHYNINFENTGTAPAENIVVRVEIDSQKYDINSLQFIEASNDVEVQIKGNVAEFIFGNINLEHKGHGNILLKIRTNESLMQDESVMKHADIYFDYNYPVRTNDAETVFRTLRISKNELDESVKIYPNPTKGIVFVNTNFDSVIKSVELYDVQGRLLQSSLNDSSEIRIDISTKSKGIYFVKVITAKGFKVEKISKE
jgi:hypothetical protein